MRRLRRGGVIEQAKAAVSLIDVLSGMGVEVSGFPPPGTSIKIWCPFSHLHPDGGREREMRLYGDDRVKVFCHICQQQFDVVSLSASLWDCSQPEAARRLLGGRSVVLEAVGGRTAHDLQVSAVAALGLWADAREVDRFGEQYRTVLATADRILDQSHVDVWLSAAKSALSG